MAFEFKFRGQIQSHTSTEGLVEFHGLAGYSITFLDTFISSYDIFENMQSNYF